MTDHHAMKQLLDAFFYHCPQDLRGKVMTEVPAAYNHYHGRDIVKVVRTEDGSPLR